MKLSFSPTVNPTKALVSPVRAGNLAPGAVVSVAQQNECHPAGQVLSSRFPLTLTLPSGKTDDTNEGWLLVSWHQTHTLLPLCYTVPTAPWETQTPRIRHAHTQ